MHVHKRAIKIHDSWSKHFACRVFVNKLQICKNIFSSFSRIQRSNPATQRWSSNNNAEKMLFAGGKGIWTLSSGTPSIIYTNIYVKL